MFLAFKVKLLCFDNFELLPFYHVQGPNSGNFAININRFRQANGSVFQSISMYFCQFYMPVVKFWYFCQFRLGRMVLFIDAPG